MSKLTENFRAARKCSVPLIAIETQDIAATIKQIAKLEANVGDGEEVAPILSWDIADGLKPRNEQGKNLLPVFLQEDQKPEDVTSPLAALALAAKFPKATILFMLNGHRFIGTQSTSEAAVGQAIWNLRDKFKSDHRTLVILCPAINLPDELKQDVLVLDEPLPLKEELQGVILGLHTAAKLPKPSPEILVRAVEAVKGLSAFAAEQAAAMSLQKTGINLEELWERKRKQVEQTPGLSVYRGKETFKDVEGIDTFKEFLSKLFKGNNPPTVLVFMDEIEKMFAGIQGDLSGVSQEQHGEFLKWMQDREALGIMAVGHPGCSKSFISKACAGEFKLPMVELNMTALKGSLVGQTGLQTRVALKTISAIGRPLILATSNSLGILPPELKRRFQLGTWFFDLPTKEERKAVWELYQKKYDVPGNFDVEDIGWTPAEIRTCCDIAYRLKCSLSEASQYIVPIIRSSPENIRRLRKEAHGRFNNANAAGTYTFKEEEVKFTEDFIRKVTLAGDNVGQA